MISPAVVNLLVLVGILSTGYWAGKLMIYVMERLD